MTVELGPVIPVLRIFSEEKMREFYLDFLGFKVDWEYRFQPDFPVHLQVSRGSFLLHLSEHHGGPSPGGHVFVEIRGVDELHRELAAKAYKYARPGIEDAAWGARTLTVTDPFANKIIFNETNRP
jgi:catechol 2,3-dioxygenase-like lactoylglutathione lyase family enzyme